MLQTVVILDVGKSDFGPVARWPEQMIPWLPSGSHEAIVNAVQLDWVTHCRASAASQAL